MSAEQVLQSVLMAVADSFMAAVIFVVIFLFGFVLAKVVGRAIRKLASLSNIEKKIKEKNLEKALLGFTVTDILAIVIEVYIVLLALGVAAGTANISTLELWALGAINYLAQAVQGIIILVVGLFVAEYISERIKNSDVLGANIIGLAVEIFIAYNALVLALPTLFPQADTALLKDSFVLLIVAFSLGIALAVGLGLGLGMRDAVSSVIKKNSEAIEALLFGKKPTKRARKR